MSDVDEEAHERLLKSIEAIGRPEDRRKRTVLNKQQKHVSVAELVGVIHSTRNVDDVKKAVSKKGKKKKKQRKEVEGAKTLATPLHRQATERIQSSVAYSEARKDLSVWAPVVQEFRLADQMVFPMEKVESIDKSAAQTLDTFKPRTPLEVKMASVLGSSKSNLRNQESYTEAELELLKAMSLKEAKAKCAQLAKMRALVSNREAKLRRQAKIKSKSYHRHLKKQKQKQLVKEFDELMTKDPEAAKEKLAEIERQRILERATLKHRNGSKRIQMLSRHAAKDTDAKRAIEAQIRIGRELVEKHGRESDSEDSGDDQPPTEQPMKAQDLLERAAELASKAETVQTAESNPELKKSLRQLRQEQKMLSERGAAVAKKALKEPARKLPVSESGDKGESASGKDWEEDAVWETAVPDSEAARIAEEPGSITKPESEKAPEILETPTEPLRKRKLKKSEKKLKKKKLSGSTTNVDELFATAEKRIEECTSQMAERIRMEEKKSSDEAGNTVDGETDMREHSAEDTASNAIAQAAARKRAQAERKEGPREVDISLDPRHFLKAETSAITQVSADLMDKVDEFDAEAEQEALVAAAFEDDDVIADFEAEKTATEEREKPKDLDLNLAGWGSWAGHGLAPRKNNRFVIKAQEKKRKDRGYRGLIIAESVDSSIDKIQPRSAGRIIKPLDKATALKEHVKEVSDEEEI